METARTVQQYVYSFSLQLECSTDSVAFDLLVALAAAAYKIGEQGAESNERSIAQHSM